MPAAFGGHGNAQRRAPAGNAPSAPLNVTSITKDAGATVSFYAPASSGSGAITDYIVTPYIGATAQSTTTVAVGSTTDTRLIFHTVALTSFMGYVMALWQGVIWFQRPALTAFKATIDGVIYAIVTGMIFVYFWPR